MSQDQNYQPKSVLFRNQDFTQYISAGMGIIDFGSYFDNEMSKNKFIMKFIKQIKLAIEHGVCKVPKDYVFPEKEAYCLDAIWNGTCYYGVLKNPFLRRFHYFKPEEPYDEIVQLPKFRNMIPNQKISDETLLIQIRESIPLKYAFEGSSYATLINDAGLTHQMSDGSMPKFSQQDMNSLTMKSYNITRQVFNSLMEDFEYFFNENWNIISISFQKIIDHSGMGLGMEDFIEKQDSFIAGVD